MNRKTIMLLLLTGMLCLLQLAACGEEEEEEVSESGVSSEQVPEKAKQVQKETQEAMESAATYADEKKEQYLQQARKNLADIDREIEQLESQFQNTANDLQEATKEEFGQAMTALREQRQEASEQLQQLQAAGGEIWEDMKAGMDSVMDELHQSYDQAVSYVDETVEESTQQEGSSQ